MTDSNDTEGANEQRRNKLVRAGVAVGIGSAAIVAALSLRLQGQEEAAPLSSCAAVPFFKPHQLIVIAIGRVGWVELGSKRLAARQPLGGRVCEVPIGVPQELARLHVLVRPHQSPELAAISGERPIFERFRVA